MARVPDASPCVPESGNLPREERVDQAEDENGAEWNRRGAAAPHES